MNKLSKVGLTALATTLVTSASVAGELSVSGSATLSYTGFQAPQTLIHGQWVTVLSLMVVRLRQWYDCISLLWVRWWYIWWLQSKTRNGWCRNIIISGNSSSGSGVDKLKDIVPNAYTPVYEATDATDSGLIDASGNNQAGQWGYDVSVGPLALSASYNPKPGSHKKAETGYAVVYSGLMDGLELSAGMFDDGDEAENETYGVKYTMGNVTAAYQMTKVDYTATTNTDQDATHYGVSVAVNEDLSISAGRQEIEFDGAADDEINSGMMASYTMGSISISGGFNKLEAVGGSASAEDVDASILNISFSF